jgi:hypothetical protein
MAFVFAWRPGVHLAIIAFLFWFVLNTEGLTHLLGWGDVESTTIYIFVPLALWALMQLFDARGNAFSITGAHYAFFVFLISYGVMHFADNGDKTPDSSWLTFAVATSLIAFVAGVAGVARKAINIVDLLGIAFACVTAIAYVFMVHKDDHSLDVPYLAFTLIIILWSLQRGVRSDDRFVINLSVVAFGAWVLYVYFVLFSGLMDQAVFFTVGGLLLILLGLGLEGMRRRLVGAKPAVAGGAS